MIKNKINAGKIRYSYFVIDLILFLSFTAFLLLGLSDRDLINKLIQ